MGIWMPCYYGEAEPLEIATFSDGTDEQIAAMLEAHYNNEIDINDYWAIGDTRRIHLSKCSNPRPLSGNFISAQDVTIVIVDMKHTPLATPINGHTNAAITVQFRESLGEPNSYNGLNGTIYLRDDAQTGTLTKWSNIYMRTYLNDTLLNAFTYSRTSEGTSDLGSGTSFKDMIKPSKHYRHTTYNGSASEQVTDTLFLPSYPEIYGTASYSMYASTNPVEGTQFEYYKTSSNRIKRNNNNGQTGNYTYYYWIGSPSTYSDFYCWLAVMSDGTINQYFGNTAYGMAPAWAM